MGAGDTINGQNRYVALRGDGSVEVVAGPYSTNQMDQRSSTENALYLNMDLPVSQRNQSRPPIGGVHRRAARAVFLSGETLRVQHKSASLEEAIDYDADEYELTVIKKNLNYPPGHPQHERVETLTVNDTDVAANPTSSSSSWVTFFEDAVPDREVWIVAGKQVAAPVENA